MNEELRDKAKEDKIIDEKRKIYEFAKSEQWKAVKTLLVKRMMEIDSCSLIAEASKTIIEAGELTLVNGKVVKVISGWLAEIEGEADVFLQLIEQMKEEKSKSDNLIYRSIDE